MSKKEIRPTEKKVEIKTPSGLKEYNFTLLTRKEAMQVFHNSLMVIVKAISGLGEADKIDLAKIGQALSSIDFEVVWGLGEKLLAFCIIDGEEIQDINKTDYFDENPEELYIAIYHAIMANYPKVFLNLKGALSALGLQDKMKKALETAKEV